MVGGTKLPPQDSQSEPGCYERKTRATARTKAKTLYEGKRQKPSQVYVSLDNADTVIDGDPPHCLKPHAERSVGVLKNCPCRYRGLVPTIPAPQQHRSDRRTFPAATTWTTKALRPSQLQKIGVALLFAGKEPVELPQIPRVILHPRILDMGAW